MLLLSTYGAGYWIWNISERNAATPGIIHVYVYDVIPNVATFSAHNQIHWDLMYNLNPNPICIAHRFSSLRIRYTYIGHSRTSAIEATARLEEQITRIASEATANRQKTLTRADQQNQTRGWRFLGMIWSSMCVFDYENARNNTTAGNCSADNYKNT